MGNHLHLLLEIPDKESALAGWNEVDYTMMGERRRASPNDSNVKGNDVVGFGGGLATLPLREARELFEREYLMTQINRFGGNISRTAAFVGMERSALHRKLKSLGVVTSNKAGARVAQVQDDDMAETDAE